MKYLPTATLAVLLAAGPLHAQAPLFGPVAPPVSAAPGAPLMPTPYANVFVREAPGTSVRSVGPSLVYRAPGAPLPPFAPRPAGSGAGIAQETPLFVNGRPFAYADPSMFPRARAVLSPAGVPVVDCGPTPVAAAPASPVAPAPAKEDGR